MLKIGWKWRLSTMQNHTRCSLTAKELLTESVDDPMQIESACKSPTLPAATDICSAVARLCTYHELQCG
ncbi:hypothetical protein DUNSADRAFT_4659 [Dunaliella salina]|uniref:Encoded protein n=1 Tax=Dunaliella salina TaxID=3046 RepID=A0ABQ7GRG8_DUNSA|nr:hypothetical protein DUNSADRAFT_4659 [Dunaliella salina]|eukprot:KAF5837204.1 hypothetical protein DUNSADRAFT_4659 [Dunaliella salina]